MDTVEKTVETDTTKLDTIVNSENPTTLSASNGTNENDDEAKVPPLTKRQQRKIRKMAKFEITKKLKRQHERIRAKEKRAQEAALGLPGRTTQRKALKRNTIENSKNPVRVAIDLDYDDQMIDKDISKCSKQLLLVYTLNRKSEMPINLFYTSLRSDSRIGKTVSRNDGYVNWDIKFKEESYTEVFDKESIVYLSSDSETVLDQLDPNAVYIIGGLVDHNHHKGMSLERAEKHGFKTARLPLGEHVCLKTRTVLTIVHGKINFTRSILIFNLNIQAILKKKQIHSAYSVRHHTTSISRTRMGRSNFGSATTEKTTYGRTKTKGKAFDRRYRTRSNR